MNKKITLAVVATIITLGIGISVSQSILVQKKYENILHLDATFYSNKKYVEITFYDETKKTSSVVLEVLGMEKSYQKTLDGPSFKIIIPFEKEPQYGWKVVPVTLVVNHPNFGKVGIKTDIHDEGKESRMIYTQL